MISPSFATRRTVDGKRREIYFDPEFIKDLRYWIRTDKRNAMRVLDIVTDVLRDPFSGLGKPEPLKYLGSNIWSRRLSLEHRIVYLVRDDRLDFLQARYHY
jgi:toxin YoeB